MRFLILCIQIDILMPFAEMRLTIGYWEYFEKGIKTVYYYFVSLQHENREYKL